MTKLVLFYENYLDHTYGDDDSIVISSIQTRSPMYWIEEVSRHYSLTTLERLLASTDIATKRAAAWALRYLGNSSQYLTLGFLLRDDSRAVRGAADEARRAIARRTQSSSHRKAAYEVEQYLADENYIRAEELATRLIKESSGRADAYYLRAWIRFTNSKIEEASADCKHCIRLDPFSYQACVALGQCYWHLGNDGAAMECYLESARIYPDWEPACLALDILAGNS